MLDENIVGLLTPVDGSQILLRRSGTIHKLFNRLLCGAFSCCHKYPAMLFTLGLRGVASTYGVGVEIWCQQRFELKSSMMVLEMV